MRNLTIWAVLLLCLSSAHAAPKQPAPDWAQYHDTLARVLIAEADASTQDWAAIAWVLEHRRENADMSPAGALRYSATLRRSTPRTALIHSLGGADEVPRIRTRQFERAQLFVRAWQRGDIADPCPRATDFYGLSDSRPAWFVDVGCGRTLNVFGTTAARR